MDNPLTPEKQNAVIEDALHTYPMASMPHDITADVNGAHTNHPGAASLPLHLE